MPNQELQQYIEQIARKWVEEYISTRKNVLANRKIQSSGSLRDSFAYALAKEVSDVISNRIELEFSEYGRYLEIKGLNVPSGGQEYIDGLAAWIQKKGLEAKMTADFIRKRNLKQAPANVLNQLAWSIAIARSRRVRRRVWYNKSKSAAITDLFNQVSAGIPDIVMDQIKKSFSNQ
jgi:hypothetical protein